MDISVSLLNKRMALQLPAELPLGLVFVVGRVRDLTNIDGLDGPPYFYISERGYMLRCQLSDRALEAISVNEGDMIRAGGHLAFDTLQADYFLLARDIEVLPEQRLRRTKLAPILADIKKRSQAASLAPAELPDWVQQIAPPELQEAQESAEPEGESTPESETTVQTAGPDTVIEPATKPAEIPLEEPSLPDGFTGNLVQFLSEAMDSPEDVELTQEMVAELAPAIQPEQGRFKAAQPYDVTSAPSDTRIPWAIVLLIVFSLILFLSLILLLALLAAR